MASEDLLLKLPVWAMVIVMGASTAGCSIAPVSAWDKQDLARPEMELDPDRLESRYADHIYMSREGSAGGWSIGGGGCGCN